MSAVSQVDPRRGRLIPVDPPVERADPDPARTAEALDVRRRAPHAPLTVPIRHVLAKRAIDVSGALVLLLLVLPIVLLAATAVAVTSRGPVFFVQERVGRNGHPFRMLKFRSMYPDAEARQAALASRNQCYGPVFKIRDDPRVTPVGRVMRKLSIDELPQLIHVLTGAMSLVGPRPPVPSEVATYTDYQRQRLLVKPGLTCIWQIEGRSDIADFDEWVEMDLDYIRRWTLGLDLAILARTIPAVLTGRGAY